ncbi:MAG TPA: DUF3500 domain-containing protein [Verrucomicrobiales bacterium]|nr:DUF3500 domain-containing protein [Verrucomicrobiales bacterium]
MKKQLVLALTLGVAAPVPYAAAHVPAEDMTEAALTFLAALNDEQRARASFAFDSDERKNWHFIPKERNGLPLKDMTDVQRQLAHALLVTGLSHKGYRKAVSIMTLEQILHELEGRNPRRDPLGYFVSVFGTPAGEGVWGWRFEGHHLSLNFLVEEGEIAGVTPSFFATNPAEVREGPRRGLRVLAAEEDLARELVGSLDENQRKTAVFSSDAPEDILTGAERKVSGLEPKGLAYADMTPAQQELLRKLVSEYLQRHRNHVAGHELERIESSGWDQVSFAWGGGLEKGQGHYYRVQGGHFLLEYANTQNDANHVHSVWRDFTSDFGDDPLRRHYEENPH